MGYPGPQAAKSPVGLSELAKLAAFLGAQRTQFTARPAPIDEDGALVEVPSGTAAPGFPAASGNPGDPSPQEGSVVAEGLEDGAKLFQEAVKPLAVYAGVVGTPGPGGSPHATGRLKRIL